MLLPQRYIFSSKSQLSFIDSLADCCCCCYHKGTYFQANHNKSYIIKPIGAVVVATTKVHIFKQITTKCRNTHRTFWLLLLPQRYIFSSKSQQEELECIIADSCCCYHKGTYFQANHNYMLKRFEVPTVVVATTKVHIFKQITTGAMYV